MSMIVSMIVTPLMFVTIMVIMLMVVSVVPFVIMLMVVSVVSFMIRVTPMAVVAGIVMTVPAMLLGSARAAVMLRGAVRTVAGQANLLAGVDFAGVVQPRVVLPNNLNTDAVALANAPA